MLLPSFWRLSDITDCIVNFLCERSNLIIIGSDGGELKHLWISVLTDTIRIADLSAESLLSELLFLKQFGPSPWPAGSPALHEQRRLCWLCPPS